MNKKNLYLFYSQEFKMEVEMNVQNLYDACILDKNEKNISHLHQFLIDRYQNRHVNISIEESYFLHPRNKSIQFQFRWNHDSFLYHQIHIMFIDMKYHLFTIHRYGGFHSHFYGPNKVPQGIETSNQYLIDFFDRHFEEWFERSYNTYIRMNMICEWIERKKNQWKYSAIRKNMKELPEEIQRNILEYYEWKDIQVKDIGSNSTSRITGIEIVHEKFIFQYYESRSGGHHIDQICPISRKINQIRCMKKYIFGKFENLFQFMENNM